MSDLKTSISAMIDDAGPGHVWVPSDFAHLGSRDAIDKSLQRMVHAGDLRRIDRGLYDRPTANRLTKRPSSPDYRAVVDAVARRDQLRLLVDGMTAANDLGLTDAVPARVTIHTDARRRAIQLDKLTVEFKHTAPSRLYWAGRPAMRVVQALYWLKDTLASDRGRILARLVQVLADPPFLLPDATLQLVGAVHRPAVHAAARTIEAGPPATRTPNRVEHLDVLDDDLRPQFSRQEVHRGLNIGDPGQARCRRQRVVDARIRVGRSDADKVDFAALDLHQDFATENVHRGGVRVRARVGRYGVVSISAGGIRSSGPRRSPVHAPRRPAACLPRNRCPARAPLPAGPA